MLNDPDAIEKELVLLAARWQRLHAESLRPFAPLDLQNRMDEVRRKTKRLSEWRKMLLEQGKLF